MAGAEQLADDRGIEPEEILEMLIHDAVRFGSSYGCDPGDIEVPYADDGSTGRIQFTPSEKGWETEFIDS